MSGDNQEVNPLELSDEDFLKVNPTGERASQETEEPKPVEGENKTEVAEENKETTTENKSEENKEEEKGENKSTEKAEEKAEEWKEYTPDPDKSDDENAAAKAEHDKTKPAATTKEDDEKNPDGTPKDKTETAQVETPVDYKAAYDRLMLPFKANGKEIKVNNVDEAIRLMQMGAGLGKKLQSLQPHLKTIRVLEKNNILDPTRISYLIDIHNKNPNAIKKLVKESGIDPLDFNTDDTVSYTPTNHSVSDSEMNFKDVLDEVSSTPSGKELVQIINSTWDQKSKQALWESPQILEVIQSQRENGVFDQINAEIDRQKLLGHIPPNTPFLAAYKTAGDVLVKENRLKPPTTTDATTTSTTTQQPTVIETRTAPVKSQVTNSDKAEAAASTNASSRKAAEIKNPLEMADEDFLKQFNGRLG